MAEKQAPIRVGFYDIEKTIGKGNFAVVKLARHRLTKTEVAIKIIDKTQLQPADLRRAYREVRVLKKLHHPHIIRLYQVMETKNMLYIVTEYAPQGEVFEHIARHGRLPEDRARRLYWQVVSAVDYCHNKSVVHRDLKAENLLLDGEGCVKLADFGFSQFYSTEATLSTWCGSPPYAAPEVFEGRNYIGPEVDIWSLGVVLYVLVCGALPFDASSLPALRDRVLSARYRVPYFMSAECESLVRKMLVKEPSKRYTINQVKRHRWMQVDGPPRLLPAPNHSPAAAVNNSCHNKQYLDPGAPDVPSEPNEQILKLMSSLGIDSSRTREAIRNGAYDHHSAIYFLLLERLRQHRPGGHRYASSVSGIISNSSSSGISSGPPTSGIRMLSNDSSTCRTSRTPPRRPSTIAEQAIMKIVPGQISEVVQLPQPQPQSVPPQTVVPQSHGASVGSSSWKTHRGTSQGSQGPQSQTSSVDEGVADMDGLSGWMDPDNSSSGGVGGGPGSSSGSSSIAPSNTSSAAVRSRTDWKWPTRGSTGSSIQISSDLSQGSGSPRESMSSSGTTLSSWDSASLHFQNWDTGGLGLAAASLPSCTQSNSNASEERRSSITGPEPLSPGPCLTADRLWVPPHAPGSPTEFRLGRRASDGLVGRIAPFPSKLEVARAGGIATIAEKEHHHLRKDGSESFEEGCGAGVDPSSLGINFPDHPALNLSCSPAKRPSLPILPDLTWAQSSSSSYNAKEPNEGCGTGNSAHLYRQLMSLRLQRRSGAVDPLDMGNFSDANARANARKSVLRQQSYKLAQQQNVLPPLPPGIDSCVFRSISQDESRLHAHEEEEEDEEDSVNVGGPCSLNTLNNVSFDGNSRSSLWQTLPVTMNDCKLTDSNTSLSRLSPLLRLSHFQSPSSSPIPFPWEHHHHLQQHPSLHQQQSTTSGHSSSIHLTPQNPSDMDMEK